MLKTHIIVTQDTDAAVELESLKQLAQKHRLDPATSTVMLAHVGALIVDIKDNLSELASSHIAADIKKSATSADYKVTLEASWGPRAKNTKGKSFLSFLHP